MGLQELVNVSLVVRESKFMKLSTVERINKELDGGFERFGSTRKQRELRAKRAR